MGDGGAAPLAPLQPKLTKQRPQPPCRYGGCVETFRKKGQEAKDGECSGADSVCDWMPATQGETPSILSHRQMATPFFPLHTGEIGMG